MYYTELFCSPNAKFSHIFSFFQDRCQECHHVLDISIVDPMLLVPRIYASPLMSVMCVRICGTRLPPMTLFNER